MVGDICGVLTRVELNTIKPCSLCVDSGFSVEFHIVLWIFDGSWSDVSWFADQLSELAACSLDC